MEGVSTLPFIFKIIALVVTIAFLIIDNVAYALHPGAPTFKAASIRVGAFVVAALAFGGIVWWLGGSTAGIQFYAGWLTEYSLSIDNLFVFVLILGKFLVPKELQEYVLAIGITLALILRAIFILLGAVVIERFTWIFFFFGIFLLYTGTKLVIDEVKKHAAQNDPNSEPQKEEEDNPSSRFMEYMKKIIPTTPHYRGKRLVIVENGKKLFTPLLLVFCALGVTDVLFAFDSIPAIFGLTRDPFIVFTANVFALLGLQQLYFLIGGLIDKLRYLPFGLAAVLVFISIKLIMEAFTLNTLPFINNGHPIHAVPEIPAWVSLLVIVFCITVAALASVIADRLALKKVREENGEISQELGTEDSTVSKETLKKEKELREEHKEKKLEEENKELEEENKELRQEHKKEKLEEEHEKLEKENRKIEDKGNRQEMPTDKGSK